MRYSFPGITMDMTIDAHSSIKSQESGAVIQELLDQVQLHTVRKGVCSACSILSHAAIASYW